MSPDDECQVCGTTREHHGDKNHKFSTDGSLVPVEAGPKPTQQPPTPRGSALANDPVARMQIRLVERMVSKGLMDGEDLLYIFGGNSSASH